MPIKWYQKGVVQAAIITGFSTLIVTILTVAFRDKSDEGAVHTPPNPPKEVHPNPNSNRSPKDTTDKEPSPKPSPPPDSSQPKRPQAFKVFIDVGYDQIGAEIYIDGKKQAETAPCTLVVAEGPHQLELIYTELSYGYEWMYQGPMNVTGNKTESVPSDRFRKKNISE
jgi:PEGA domain